MESLESELHIALESVTLATRSELIPFEPSMGVRNECHYDCPFIGVTSTSTTQCLEYKTHAWKDYGTVGTPIEKNGK